MVVFNNDAFSPERANATADLLSRLYSVPKERVELKSRDFMLGRESEIDSRSRVPDNTINEIFPEVLAYERSQLPDIRSLLTLEHGANYKQASKRLNATAENSSAIHLM